MSGQDSFETSDAPTGVDLPSSRVQVPPSKEDESMSNQALRELDAVEIIIKRVQNLGLSMGSSEFVVIFDAMMRVYYRSRFSEAYS